MASVPLVIAKDATERQRFPYRLDAVVSADAYETPRGDHEQARGAARRGTTASDSKHKRGGVTVRLLATLL